MARSLASKPNVIAPDSDYPFGRVRDDNGTGNGTPVNEETCGDQHQFFEKLLSEGGVPANGMPENEYSGFQYWEALIALMGGLKTKVINIGAWDMQTTDDVLVATGIDASKVREISIFIRIDGGTELSSIFSRGVASPTLDGSFALTSTGIRIFRKTGGQYDDVLFSGGSNRGFIVIRYTAD